MIKYAKFKSIIFIIFLKPFGNKLFERDYNFIVHGLNVVYLNVLFIIEFIYFIFCLKSSFHSSF